MVRIPHIFVHRHNLVLQTLTVTLRSKGSHGHHALDGIIFVNMFLLNCTYLGCVYKKIKHILSDYVDCKLLYVFFTYLESCHVV